MTILMYLIDDRRKLVDSPVYGDKIKEIAQQYGVDPNDIQCCEGGPDEDARYAYFRDAEGGHHYIPICKFDTEYFVGQQGYVGSIK